MVYLSPGVLRSNRQPNQIRLDYELEIGVGAPSNGTEGDQVMHVKIAIVLLSFLTMGFAQAESGNNNGASGKDWTPPPGLLSDSTISSLAFSSDKQNNGHSNSGRGHVNQVPEPGTILLLGAGLVGLVASRARNRNRLHDGE